MLAEEPGALMNAQDSGNVADVPRTTLRLVFRSRFACPGERVASRRERS